MTDGSQSATVAEVIVKSANTGKIGDGKVFILPALDFRAENADFRAADFRT